MSKTQGLLLQRYHDGELSAAESVQAEQLLERSAPARVLVRALEELSQAAKIAGEVAWERAREKVAPPEVVVQMAERAGDLTKAPLEELAPLLERFHDAEADQAEMAFVSALLNEREDVVDYLAELDGLQKGLRAAGEQWTEGVDFASMWRGIEAEIDADQDEHGDDGDDVADFDREQHLVLVQRFFDGEVSAEEASQVERWLEQGDEDVSAYLEALSELELGVTAAVETACERAALRGIWTGVSQQLGAHDADSDVVSIDRARERRQAQDSGARGDGWLKEYRQAVVGALAAAVVLAGLVGLFKDAIFGPNERVIVEKRVVVVEQVEYSPGASVMIDSPMRQASMNGEQAGAAEDPTVIWLFDSDEPSAAEQPAGADPNQDDAGDQQDAHSPDAGRGPEPTGQPI